MGTGGRCFGGGWVGHLRVGKRVSGMRPGREREGKGRAYQGGAEARRRGGGCGHGWVGRRAQEAGLRC